MSELELLADCLKDVTKERDELSAALEQTQGKLACSAAIEKGVVKALSTAAGRIEQLEAALRPMTKAHKSDRPYNEITLHDCQVAFDLLEIAGDTLPSHCEWFEDDDGWHGSCGKDWEFIDDGPKENGVNFCMDCGRPVQVATEFVEDTCGK